MCAIKTDCQVVFRSIQAVQGHFAFSITYEHYGIMLPKQTDRSWLFFRTVSADNDVICNNHHGCLCRRKFLPQSSFQLSYTLQGTFNIERLRHRYQIHVQLYV